MNRNVNWLGGGGGVWFWLAYILLLGILRGVAYLLTPPNKEEWGWTALNLAHAVVSATEWAARAAGGEVHDDPPYTKPFAPSAALTPPPPHTHTPFHLPPALPFPHRALALYFSAAPGVLLCAALEARLARVGGPGGAH
jgi:hypothetical protein